MPSASAASVAAKAAPKGMPWSWSAREQMVHARALTAMRAAPRATTTIIQAPTPRMLARIGSHPACRTLTISRATPSAATTRRVAEKRDRVEEAGAVTGRESG